MTTNTIRSFLDQRRNFSKNLTKKRISLLQSVQPHAAIKTDGTKAYKMMRSKEPLLRLRMCSSKTLLSIIRTSMMKKTFMKLSVSFKRAPLKKTNTASKLTAQRMRNVNLTKKERCYLKSRMRRAESGNPDINRCNLSMRTLSKTLEMPIRNT